MSNNPIEEIKWNHLKVNFKRRQEKKKGNKMMGGQTEHKWQI